MSSIKDTLKRVYAPIHPEGYNIIIIALIFAFIAAMLSTVLGTISFVLVLFCVYFFRNPARIVPDGDDLIIAPADGTLDAIEECNPPEELELDSKLKWTRVSIFLSVFNVHVQRIPIDGKITKLHYRAGKFVNVSNDKYSKDNERQSCVLATKDGTQIPFVQIAGLIARRIVCNLQVGQEVKAGDVYGIIRFGSRVDIYLPEGIKPNVKIGQTIVGGETVIAKLK